jgi:hypothetical protein
MLQALLSEVANTFSDESFFEIKQAILRVFYTSLRMP